MDQPPSISRTHDVLPAVTRTHDALPSPGMMSRSQDVLPDPRGCRTQNFQAYGQNPQNAAKAQTYDAFEQISGHEAQLLQDLTRAGWGESEQSAASSYSHGGGSRHGSNPGFRGGTMPGDQVSTMAPLGVTQVQPGSTGCDRGLRLSRDRSNYGTNDSIHFENNYDALGGLSSGLQSNGATSVGSVAGNDRAVPGRYLGGNWVDEVPDFGLPCAGTSSELPDLQGRSGNGAGPGAVDFFQGTDSREMPDLRRQDSGEEKSPLDDRLPTILGVGPGASIANLGFAKTVSPLDDDDDESRDIMPPPLAQADKSASCPGIRKKKEKKGALSFMSSPGAMSSSETRDPRIHQGKFDMSSVLKMQLRQDVPSLVCDISACQVVVTNVVCDNLFGDVDGTLVGKDVCSLCHPDDSEKFSACMTYVLLSERTKMDPQDISIVTFQGRTRKVKAAGQQLVGLWWQIDLQILED